MARIDTEFLFNKLKTYLQANIPLKISEINTEKGDGINMVAPSSPDAYIDFDLDAKAMNYDPFVFLYVESQQATVEGPVVSKKIRFEVAYFVAKTSDDNEQRLGLRYMRMMEEVASGAFERVLRGFRYEVETLDPVDAQLVSSNKWHKVYSVALTVNLAN